MTARLTDPPTSRALTEGEVALCRPLFGEAIDYPRVRVHRRRWWPLQPRDTIMAPDGAIWCHPQGSGWRDDYAEASPAMQALFVHEMTHVWQAQKGGRWYLPLLRHPFCRYDYALAPGKPFARYGIEQQAEIVRVAFEAMRRGERVPEMALLPFAGLEKLFSRSA